MLVNDTTSATATIQKYFSTLYKNQINATGEQVRAVSRDESYLHPLTYRPQPFEAVRTRPYHYRSYNLAAMIVRSRAPTPSRIWLTTGPSHRPTRA